MNRIALLILSLLLIGVAHSQSPKIVTALRANGTYRYHRNEIRILSLGHNKLRVQMDLTYEYKTKYGPMANIGSSIGTATITDDTAVLRPPESRNCTITIKFLTGNRIKVTQDSDAAECGFGNPVFADGTYAKDQRRKAEV